MGDTPSNLTESASLGESVKRTGVPVVVISRFWSKKLSWNVSENVNKRNDSSYVDEN
mgnify:CR=1